MAAGNAQVNPLPRGNCRGGCTHSLPSEKFTAIRTVIMVRRGDFQIGDILGARETLAFVTPGWRIVVVNHRRPPDCFGPVFDGHDRVGQPVKQPVLVRKSSFQDADPK